jgi:hypothetical protein
MSTFESYWTASVNSGIPSLSPIALAVLAAIIAALGVIVFVRAAPIDPLAALMRLAARIAAVGMLVAAVVIALKFLDRLDIQERAAERRALEARLSELTVRAIAANPMLACLDASAADKVAGACEEAVFARPQSVAAATAYVSAQLALLLDGSAYARGHDGAFAAALARLRRAAEFDRFGLFAHVLAYDYGCTAQDCRVFAWIADMNRIEANLKAGTFDATLARYAGVWAAAAAPQVVIPALSRATLPARINVPSAVSVPAAGIASPGTAEAHTGPPAVPVAGSAPRASAAPRAPGRPSAPPGRVPMQLSPVQADPIGPPPEQ